METNTIQMTDQQFDRLREIIHNYSGIWFADDAFVRAGQSVPLS